jgi:hypothetical protein
MSNIQEFYNLHNEYREIMTMNSHIKGRPLILILFLIAFFLVIFRLSNKSESAK